MHILNHDFAGHPFQIQLSRALSARGHAVTHVYPIGLPGPKGALQRRPSDCDRLRIEGIQLSGHFRKYSPARRLLTQRQYSRQLRSLIRTTRPDVVLSGNTPIDVQAELLSGCQRNGIAFVHWIQDIYFEALNHVLRPRLGRASEIVTLPFRWLEKRVTRRSDGVVVIAAGFRDYLKRLGCDHSEITLIENWAPLEEVPLEPRRNSWSEQLGLSEQPTFVYSGTLGLKHRPELIYRLAQSLTGKARVVVLSEGIGRDYLEKMPPLENLRLLGFEPYKRLPEVLASADVLLATLEPDAGQFAVPSKVLSYLCAGRPILLAAPKENLACSIVARSGGGIAVDPNDEAACLEGARRLAENAEYRERLGAQGRAYAERTFDIELVASSFEDVFNRALQTRSALSKLPLPKPASSFAPNIGSR
jgi:colanic acid biosynthesis glycosyl transferase WcaI